MVRNHVFTAILFCLISTVAIADPQQNPDKEAGNSVEETERQKIITELSYRLETKLTCKQKLTWSDKGSGAELHGFFFTPSAESSYFIIGGYASRKGDPQSKKCVISVRQSKNNPEETPELLVPPSDWSLIWTDKGSGANTDGSMGMIQRSKFELEGTNELMRVTVSIGVVSCKEYFEEEINVDKVFDMAGKALEIAKKNGGGRVECFSNNDSSH